MGCEMAKMSRMEIHLDNSLAIYQPGEVLGGHLLLEVLEDVPVHGGRIWFYGNSETAWVETDHKTGKTDTITGQQMFFQNCVTLFGKEVNDNSHETEFIIRAGHHNFPFEFLLPEKIPSSFELCGDSRARIRYSVRAEIENAERSVSHSIDKAFLILAPFDLNYQNNLRDRVSLRKEFSLACCCVSKGAICCELALNKTGFVPGETLKIDIHVLNHSSALVRSTSITFEQRMILNGGHSSSKQVSALVFSITGQRIKSGGTGFYHDVIHVPPLPPTGLHGCDIVHVDYIVQVSIEAGGRLSQPQKLEMSLPVLIGSIPIRDAFSDSTEVVPCYAFFDYSTGDIREYEPAAPGANNSGAGGMDYLRPCYRYYKTEKRTRMCYPIPVPQACCQEAAQRRENPEPAVSVTSVVNAMSQVCNNSLNTTPEQRQKQNRQRNKNRTPSGERRGNHHRQKSSDELLSNEQRQSPPPAPPPPPPPPPPPLPPPPPPSSKTHNQALGAAIVHQPAPDVIENINMMHSNSPPCNGNASTASTLV